MHLCLYVTHFYYLERFFSIFDTRTCGTITLDTIVIIREIVLFYTSKNDKQINTNQWEIAYISKMNNSCR